MDAAHIGAGLRRAYVDVCRGLEGAEASVRGSAVGIEREDDAVVDEFLGNADQHLSNLTDHALDFVARAHRASAAPAKSVSEELRNATLHGLSAEVVSASHAANVAARGMPLTALDPSEVALAAAHRVADKLDTIGQRMHVAQSFVDEL